MSTNSDVFVSSSSLDHVQVIVLNGLIATCSRVTPAHVMANALNAQLETGAGYICTNGFMATPFSRTSSSSNRQLKRNDEFVRLEEDFNQELIRKELELGDRSYTILQNVRQFISVLLDLKPTAISVQATFDRSVLFTVIIGDYIGYFEYWMDYNLSGSDDPEDEMVLNVFKNKEHVLNYAGEFIPAFAEFVKVCQIKSVPIPVPA